MQIYDISLSSRKALQARAVSAPNEILGQMIGFEHES
jgi:hypothetical protein